jgi:hypothetical protein
MRDLQSRFLNQENFYLAFKKLSHYYNQSNEWFDLIELSDYEANLETNLSRLISELTEENYSPKDIEPIPFPKKNDKNGKHRIRPYFKISIEDQLVWIAIVNVIGEFLEKKMPFWSYGNRLFQPIWYEQDENGEVEIKKGSLVNSSSNFYKKWNQSWPQYRRNISLTVKVMANGSRFKETDLDEEKSKEIYRNEEKKNFTDNWYLNKDNWGKRKTNKLFWAGLDFKKFFPSIKAEFVIQNIKKFVVRDLGDPRDDTGLLFNLIEKMLSFPLKTDDWENEELTSEYGVGLKSANTFNGIPTGLLVSGFLANVAMINVDEQLTQYIKNSKNVAILKFVDDQVILSKSKKSLLSFLNFYNDLINESGIGIEFQDEKTIPENTFLFEYKKFSFNKINVKYKDPIIDVEFPQPFMTFALEKMSNLNDADLDLMDSEEIDEHESELIHFMLTDFPDSEIKKETRMAFASFKLCQLAKNIRPNFYKIDSTTDANNQLAIKLVEEEIIHHSENKNIKEQVINLRESNKNKELEVELKLVEKKIKRLFRILIRSIAENPDKLKLWKRCIEFCFNTGHDGYKIIFNELYKLNIYEKSKDYIAAYIYQQINLKSFFALNILSNPTNGYWTEYTSYLHFKNATKFYKARENQSLRIKSFHISLIHGKILHSLFEINSKNKTVGFKDNFIKKFIKQHKEANDYKIEGFIWYYINKFSKNNSLVLWKESVRLISVENKIFWSILSFYPKEIPKDVLKKIQEVPDKININEEFIYEKYEFRNRLNGIIYEIFKNSKEDKLELLKYYSNMKKRLQYEDSDYISLDDYLQKVIKQNNGKSNVDIRLSEWSLLEIIKQIINVIDKPSDIFDIFNSEHRNIWKIHPANYLIPIEWLNYDRNTWVSWSEIVSENEIILIKEDLIIEDYRFLPIDKLWKHSEISWFSGMGEFLVVIGLSSLFVKLLSRSFDWPAATNKLVFIDKVYSNIVSTLNKTNVSTDTRQVIIKIFSKKDVDFFGNGEFKDVYDKMDINDLDGFKNIIDVLQGKLKTKRLSVYDGKPRQLTLIDIDVLNEIKSII